MGKSKKYLAGDHGRPHAGWVVVHLVGRGDEVDVRLHHDGRAGPSSLLALSRLVEEIRVRSAEFVAGATGAAYLGDVLEQAGILTHGSDGSLVEEVETGTDGMGKGGNGGGKEEEEEG